MVSGRGIRVSVLSALSTNYSNIFRVLTVMRRYIRTRIYGSFCSCALDIIQLDWVNTYHRIKVRRTISATKSVNKLRTGEIPVNLKLEGNRP